MINFKTTVRNVLASIDNAIPAMNPKDEAVRRLGVAQELASAGEKAKKAAKTSLKGLGILADDYPTGTETIYESERFTVVRTTAEPATALKVDCLRAVLERRGYSQKVIAEIIAASHGTNKPATKLTVEQK